MVDHSPPVRAASAARQDYSAEPLDTGRMAQKTSGQQAPSTLTVKGRNVRIRTIGIVVLTGLAIWFIAVNTGSVAIRLWVPIVTLPLWAVLAVTLVAGVVLGGYLARRRARR